MEDIPVIDHFDYKRSKVYHAAVDFGDVVVKSINVDHLRVSGQKHGSNLLGGFWLKNTISLVRLLVTMSDY